jgi:hypothetical protein
MSALSDRVMYDETFQAACQRYAHGNGSSGGIAGAAIRASGTNELVEALTKAERFIAGFEGDELQEGIDALIAEIRAALAKAGTA